MLINNPKIVAINKLLHQAYKDNNMLEVNRLKKLRDKIIKEMIE
jgi:hypothetical protein